jgi:phosphoribosylanthranilate isomerase
MTTKIKMCGLSRPEDISAANEIRPDFIGFVFAKKSRRYVTPAAAARLKRELDPSIKAVGVFADSPISEIESLVSHGIIDMIQLHGNESEIFAEEVQDYCKCPVIKAFKIKSVEDIKAASESRCRYILLDSGAGTGKTFDWSLLSSIDRPFFLAGGLDPNNAEEAVRRLHPFCLDVSSGIETDGVKDRNKMDAFAKAVRKETI